MGRGSVSSKYLVILNIVYSLLGIGLVGFSTWFLIQVKKLTSMRNPNHFKLDSTIYYPEVIPYVYAAIGVFIFLISSCAFVGVMKKSRALLLTNIGFQALAILALVGAVSVTFINAGSKDSDKFINSTIVDAFEHMHSEGADPRVEKDFGKLEMWLECCGPHNLTDYHKYISKFDNLPISCCRTIEDLLEDDSPIKECKPKSEMVKSRHGCVDVANYYARMFYKVFAGMGIFVIFIGVLNVISAGFLTKTLSKKKEVKEMEENRIKCMVAEIEKAEKAGTLKF